VNERQQLASPVGPPVDDRPAERPGPVTLQGRYGRVEKLSATHAGSLWHALNGQDHVWTYLPGYGPFKAEGELADWVTARAALADPYSYAIVESSGRALGVFALMAIRPEHRVIEVGHVLYAPALQRSALATEAQYLLARYVFETLRYRRYEWKCDALNARSRRAALRYGFTFEGIFRQHMIAKGRNRDTAWFAMLDGDWPGRKANFERWLAPDNFTNDGRQKQSLSGLNGVAA
jgi:RimJ/RimL family protein N-acetyltransferase